MATVTQVLMNILTTITILCAIDLSLVKSNYFFESNGPFVKHPKKPGTTDVFLYECTEVQVNDGRLIMDCKRVTKSREKDSIYAKANFYSVYNAKFWKNRVLYVDGQVCDTIPYYFSVGYTSIVESSSKGSRTSPPHLEKLPDLHSFPIVEFFDQFTQGCEERAMGTELKAARFAPIGSEVMPHLTQMMCLNDIAVFWFPLEMTEYYDEKKYFNFYYHLNGIIKVYFKSVYRTPEMIKKNEYPSYEVWNGWVIEEEEKKVATAKAKFKAAKVKVDAAKSDAEKTAAKAEVKDAQVGVRKAEDEAEKSKIERWKEGVADIQNAMRFPMMKLIDPCVIHHISKKDRHGGAFIKELYANSHCKLYCRFLKAAFLVYGFGGSCATFTEEQEGSCQGDGHVCICKGVKQSGSACSKPRTKWLPMHYCNNYLRLKVMSQEAKKKKEATRLSEKNFKDWDKQISKNKKNGRKEGNNWSMDDSDDEIKFTGLRYSSPKSSPRPTWSPGERGHYGQHDPNMSPLHDRNSPYRGPPGDPREWSDQEENYNPNLSSLHDRNSAYRVPPGDPREWYGHEENHNPNLSPHTHGKTPRTSTPSSPRERKIHRQPISKPTLDTQSPNTNGNSPGRGSPTSPRERKIRRQLISKPKLDTQSPNANGNSPGGSRSRSPQKREIHRQPISKSTLGAQSPYVNGN